jgi:hypothetical protein
MHPAILLRPWGGALLRVAGLLLLATPSACFSSSSTPPSEKTCESNCERQVKAGCPKTPADYATTCTQGCLVYRVDHPDCVSEMDELSGCVDKKVSYSCDATGAIVGNPVATCLNEDYACYACTGDWSMCRY